MTGTKQKYRMVVDLECYPLDRDVTPPSIDKVVVSRILHQDKLSGVEILSVSVLDVSEVPEAPHH